MADDSVLSTPDHWALSARGRHARPFPRRGGRGPGRPLRCVRGRQGGRTGLCADQAAAGSEGVPARLQDEGAWPSAQERLRLGPPPWQWPTRTSSPLRISSGTSPFRHVTGA